MLVESAFLYSAVLVVLLMFEVRNEVAGIYIEELAIATKGIIPTILVGRVAAGHARPDDSWTGSTVSSLQFRARPSTQDDSDRSTEWAISTESTHDLEEGLEATFNFYCGWAQNVLCFSTAGKCLWETYKSKCTQDTQTLVTMGIDATLSTVLADATLIWRCWIVWGQKWCVVLVLIACTTLAIITRGIITYYSSFGPVENMSPQAVYLEKIRVNWAVLYSSSILATLLWCTIFIIYRILRVSGIAAGMRVYHSLIEMLVESASLYSAVIVVLLVFEVRSEAAEIYIEELAIATRGIVPTILVGRIAAGHARPDDSWSESTMSSSLQFRSSLSSQSDSGGASTGSESDQSPRVTLDLENGLEDSAES
ncbi:uncharacterized protein ARMOST_17401 [Armillaria ostoyae]|uniref:Uncharacterized protein n=1 Tax=Armillaria ostoyae TaxID=47428 RepID=A0A284RYZ4_ARMOS|nr:uncharacterized protein ARMOST_17401 [Armillaria ostoyae]